MCSRITGRRRPRRDGAATARRRAWGEVGTRGGTRGASAAAHALGDQVRIEAFGRGHGETGPVEAFEVQHAQLGGRLMAALDAGVLRQELVPWSRWTSSRPALAGGIGRPVANLIARTVGGREVQELPWRRKNDGERDCAPRFVRVGKHGRGALDKENHSSGRLSPWRGVDGWVSSGWSSVCCSLLWRRRPGRSPAYTR